MVTTQASSDKQDKATETGASSEFARPRTLNYKNGEELDDESTSAARDTARLIMPTSLGENKETDATANQMPIGDLPGYEITEVEGPETDGRLRRLHSSE